MGATGEYRGSIGSRPFAHGPFESGLLELAMPLRHTRHACFATEAVVADYGWTVGAPAAKIDLRPLSVSATRPEHIFAVRRSVTLTLLHSRSAF